MAGTETTYSEEWLEGYNAALDDVASFVETHTVVGFTGGAQLCPTVAKNKHGLLYAKAIREMKGTGL